MTLEQPYTKLPQFLRKSIRSSDRRFVATSGDCHNVEPLGGIKNKCETYYHGKKCQGLTPCLNSKDLGIMFKIPSTLYTPYLVH